MGIDNFLKLQVKVEPILLFQISLLSAKYDKSTRKLFIQFTTLCAIKQQTTTETTDITNKRRISDFKSLFFSSSCSCASTRTFQQIQ
jgi:hypothetical protein